MSRNVVRNFLIRLAKFSEQTLCIRFIPSVIYTALLYNDCIMNKFCAKH
jgi:hypothetical protein